ncbi:WecB/TagA/CpsF family glycosyltransferase [Gloeothece verrucosa]|uniref:Glycosyl transferase, WecB/TagA/CpsF family n=1 Tax=Gloeothece verrucosa (strain PCC 7822) TaxID=497965 RepID=E0UI38_GLOV7|nr:WecB/TagA/CpsF family glycosyltransferase [Gloeothece verrucosa]ADN15690.1 glycosyl transferase, WecB/TagA/CpsF family [Gloeothece verrucosa PCC 7822]
MLPTLVENPKTFSVLNLPVHLLDNYTAWLLKRLENKQGTHVVTLNAEMAILAQQDPTVAQIIEQADLVIPDGAGIIFYLRLRGQKQQRCPGIELAQSLVQQIGELGQPCSIAFYGGKPGIPEKAAQIWQQKLPKLSLLSNHGYLNEEEQQQWQTTLQQKQPKLILVGLGVPRQELWIQQHRYLCPDAIWIGVGGSFDIWSGNKTRAPLWLQKSNLEWLYRLYQEPWRWRRMLALPEFFWQSLKF